MNLATGVDFPVPFYVSLRILPITFNFSIFDLYIWIIYYLIYLHHNMYLYKLIRQTICAEVNPGGELTQP